MLPGKRDFLLVKLKLQLVNSLACAISLTAGRSKCDEYPVSSKMAPCAQLYHFGPLLVSQWKKFERTTITNKGCSTSSCASLFRRLGAFLEFEPTNIATADHALIVDCVSADDFGHQGEIKVGSSLFSVGNLVRRAEAT